MRGFLILNTLICNFKILFRAFREFHIYFYLMTLRTQIKAKFNKSEKQNFTLDTNKLNSYLILNTE